MKLVSAILIFMAGVWPFNRANAQPNPYDFKVGHPRIIMNKYDELALRFTMIENPLANKLKNELKVDADKLLTSKNIKYVLDKQKSMLGISQEYVKRILTLSLAYRIFENDKYSDKAIELMMNACDFPDWNPQYFLDVAEMTTAMAIGYDWNFYHLNALQKETIRNKIVENGLNPGLAVLNDPIGKPHAWTEMDSYWNPVCTGGLILGALAVGEDFPDLKNSIIYMGIKKLLPMLQLYEPDGLWYQGPAYWSYSNTYLALTCASLKSALEHDFGLSSRPAMDQTASAFIHVIGPTGLCFNYGDTEYGDKTIYPELGWFGKEYNDDDVSAFVNANLNNNITATSPGYGSDRGHFFYLSLPWYNDRLPKNSSDLGAWGFDGLVDLFVLQSLNGGDDALYLAAKGGKGSLDHQQLDAGTFVVDANGERWGVELIQENYLPGMSDDAVGGGRWQHFGNTNKSHSTLVIGDGLQNPDGEANLIKSISNAQQPFGIFDLSEVYKNTSKVLRGFKMLNDDQVLVRDEITFEGESQTVRWGMVTDANVELFGNKAVLAKNGKKFFLQAFGGEEVVFELETLNSIQKDTKDNSGKRLIFVLANKGLKLEKVELSVVMGNNTDGLNDTISNTKIANW